MKGREKMTIIEILNVIRCVSITLAALALIGVGIAWIYDMYRDTVEDEVQERLKKAVEDAARPVVKVEIQTRGKW